MVAKIYIAARSAMQSAQKKNWILEYTQSKPFYIDPTMGWAGSSDVQQHIRLEFKSKEEALAYAKSNNIEYVIEDVIPATITARKSYVDNFKPLVTSN